MRAIPFRVLDPSEVSERPPLRRRSWGALVDALVGGESVFVEDKYVNANGVKYLRLVFLRRAAGERLRSERTGTGRKLWLESEIEL